MKKKIIIINGSGGCGKDTFINLCGYYANVMNVSSVDIIKEMAKVIGWEGSKTEKDRKFLSDLKLLSTEYNNASFDYMQKKVNEFKDSANMILFLHIREPEEIEIAKKVFKANTLLIKNKNVKEISTNMADANVDNYKYDYVINNDFSLEDYNQMAKDFVNNLWSFV